MNFRRRFIVLGVTATAFLAGAATPASAGQDPCREVFADRICDMAENPGPLIWDVTDPIVATVTCAIDPNCSR